MFMRRRPLVRAAVVGGGAYYAGKKVQQGRQEDANTEARLEALESEQPGAQPAPAAAGGDLVKQLEDLKRLLDEGVLTQAEFDAQKQKLLAST
jgi:Short C-terminal domain